MLENFSRTYGQKAQELQLATELIGRAKFITAIINDRTMALLLESATELSEKYLAEADRVSKGLKAFPIRRARVIHNLIRDEEIEEGRPLPVDEALIKTQRLVGLDSLGLGVQEIEPEPTEFLLRFILKFVSSQTANPATREKIAQYLTLHPITGRSANFWHLRVGDANVTPSDILKEHAVFFVESPGAVVFTIGEAPSFQSELLATYMKIVKAQNTKTKYAGAWEILTQKQREGAHFLVKIPIQTKEEPDKKLYLYGSFIF